MHALSRHVAWHTELFFTPEEFAIFWRTRDQVPLRKIQLRYLRRDGLPHSPMLRRRLRLGRPVRLSLEQVAFSGLSHEYIPDGQNQPRQTQQLSFACTTRPSLAETYEQILREQEPNFLRLYLNPHVAQVCFCLDRYVRTTWTGRRLRPGHSHAADEDCQSFLANGLEEALGGAIKLARYSRHTNGRSFDGSDSRPGRSARRLCLQRELPGGERVQFLPGLRVVGKNQLRREPGTLGLESEVHNGQRRGRRHGTQSACAGRRSRHDLLEKHAEAIRRLVRRHAPLVITCVDREAWPRFATARMASFAKSSLTSSSSTIPSWTMPCPSALSRPANRFSLAGISPAKPPFTRRPSSPIRFRPCTS